MASIDINGGNSVIDLTGAAIITSYTTGSLFYAGTCGVSGIALWCKISLSAGSTITSVTVQVQTSNDSTGTLWAPTLATLHVAGGTVNTDLAVTGLSVSTTSLFKITVNPIHLGSSDYVRIAVKANAAGTSTDEVSVKITGW